MAASGRQYRIDTRIDSADIISEFFFRSVEAGRGLIRCRKLVFLGRGVRFRRKGQILLGQLSAIGAYSSLDGRSENGVQIGEGAKLGRYVTVTGTSQLSKLGKGFSLGSGSGIGDFAHIGCAGGVTIGQNVIIGPFASFHSQEHRSARLDVPIMQQGTIESPIEIHDDVWIGARVTILSGVIIGSGSIIAAGSVVRSSFPPGSVIGGVPARALRQRSEKDELPGSRPA